MSKDIFKDDFNVVVVGLGYVGLPLAVEFGKKYNTLGFDLDKKRIQELSEFNDSTLELSSEEIKGSKYLSFSSELKVQNKKNIFIVTVPTPIDDVNKPDLSFLKAVSNNLGSLVKKGDFIIFESTVFPGCTEEVCVPIIESLSKLKMNEDIYFGYSPERIVPGDKINTVTKIKKITSGSNSYAANFVDKLYGSIITAGTYKASSIKVAEAAKVIENCQRDLNISFVNELSIIFDKIGIDTTEVIEAAATKWNFLPFRPGMVGGHCIGVDPYYLTYKAEQLGYIPQVILAGRKINDEMASHAAKLIIKEMINNKIDISSSTIGVCGITFKENCPDIRNTKIIDLITELQDWGAKVKVIDPWADKERVKDEYNVDLVDLDKEFRVDALVVAVGHEEFRNLTPENLTNLFKSNNKIIADLKSIYLKEELLNNNFKVIRL